MTGDIGKAEGFLQQQAEIGYLCRDRAGYECCGKAKQRKLDIYLYGTG